MALRMLEVTLPADRLDAVCEALEENGVIDLWRVEAEGDRGFARVLVPHERVESVSDLLVDRLGDLPHFRIVVLSVEATLPAPDEVEGEARDDEGSGEKRPARVSREELYQDLEPSIQVTWVYIATVVLSTVVAAVGLLRDDVAVIIGAMVIAPLLGPNVALSLSATLGDLDLARRAVRTNLAGVATALVLAVALGVLLHVDPAMPQIASRTRVGLADLALALAAGSAGTLAYTTGLSGAVIGVMVAVALLPPLVVAGLLVGAGFFAESVAAFTLLVANVTCVNLAGVATFLAQRVRPRGWWEEETARKATRWAIVSWLVMLAILGAVIFVLDR